jgi:1,2-diacylglycerol 3-beta-glucosyltransferase
MALVRLMRLGLHLLAGIGGFYFALLTAATFLPHRRVFSSAPIKPRFAVIVPAHNEEHTIPNTLKSLEQLDYPAECYKVFVVADNCIDATAQVARGFRCTVWERTVPERRAKGYALSWAFEQIPEEYDAVVVVDADTEVDSKLLDNFARAYDHSMALQAWQVQVAGSSVSSVASYVASALQNYLKPWGRENLGLSAGLGGNGMCIPRTLLEEVPWRRFGLGEDVEYHADLVLAGKRVRFVPEARVEAIAPHTLRGLRSQRWRWERGRVEALRRLAGPLLARFLYKQDAASFEMLMSIAAPPLNLTVSTSAACIMLGAMRRSTVSLVVGILGLIAVVCATFRTLRMVRAPAKVYIYSLLLPPYVAWRTYVSVSSLLPSVSEGWVRTERPGERDRPGWSV